MSLSGDPGKFLSSSLSVSDRDTGADALTADLQRLIEGDKRLREALPEWRRKVRNLFDPSVGSIKGDVGRGLIRERAVSKLLENGWALTDAQARSFWTQEVVDPVWEKIQDEGQSGGNHRVLTNFPPLDDEYFGLPPAQRPDAHWITFWQNTLRGILNGDAPQSEMDSLLNISKRNAIINLTNRGMGKDEANAIWSEDIKDPVWREHARGRDGGAARHGGGGADHRGNGNTSNVPASPHHKRRRSSFRA
ncbi:hypothetical protein JCM16303_005332 [Sporobolomyces ruberrimus]